MRLNLDSRNVMGVIVCLSCGFLKYLLRQFWNRCVRGRAPVANLPARYAG